MTAIVDNSESHRRLESSNFLYRKISSDNIDPCTPIGNAFAEIQVSANPPRNEVRELTFVLCPDSGISPKYQIKYISHVASTNFFQIQY